MGHWGGAEGGMRREERQVGRAFVLCRPQTVHKGDRRRGRRSGIPELAGKLAGR